LVSLTTEQVLEQIKYAIGQKQPFSLVRVGDGENLILAQDSVWPMQQVLNEAWAIKANNGEKGVTLPNHLLKEQMVAALKKSDIVGILPKGDKQIKAPGYLKRELTDKVFDYYKIQPRQICSATVMRECANKKSFWEILRGKRVILIYEHAAKLKSILKQKYKINITIALPFSHYSQINPTLAKINKYKNHFDVAIISCGVNSVILAQKIAENTGKVAIDFGKPANFLALG
jgi:hypothetical protein